MFDFATATVLFFILVASYSWFATTRFCDRLFTLPGRLLIGVVLFFVAAVYLPDAKASDITDAQKILYTVQAEIEAFENGDVALAFGLMTPELRSKIKSVEDARRLVASHMPAIAKHDVVIYGEVYDNKDYRALPVILAHQGDYFAATFFLKQNTGGWWEVDNIYFLKLKLNGA